MRYFVVGGVAALTEWSVFAILHFGTGTNYLISAVVAFAIALAVNYVLHLQLVFEGGGIIAAPKSCWWYSSASWG